MAISADGTAAIVTGPSVGVASQDDYATLAYDPTTGAPKWAARYNGPNNRGDEPVAIAVSPDSSKVVVTGSSDNGPEKTRWVGTIAVSWRTKKEGHVP